MIFSFRSLSNSRLAQRFHVAPLLLILAFGVALSWPLWWLGFPPQTDDAKNHLSWFVRFAPQFWNGELYPRWLPDMNMGLGSPAFFYYPPLAAWASSLLSAIWFTNDSWIAVGRSASFALVASGLTMYAWLQTFVPRRWAAISAVIFLIGPYRTAVDVYLRGALAEHWGFVWLPLLLWSAQNLTGNQSVRVSDRTVKTFIQPNVSRVRAGCALAVLFALLLLTHPPTAVVFSPVVLAYVFFCSLNSIAFSTEDIWAESSTRKEMFFVVAKSVLASLIAMGCGALLAAFYLLPALRLEPLVWMEEMRAGVFGYTHSFLTLANLRDGSRLHGIAVVTMLMVILICYSVARALHNVNSHNVSSKGVIHRIHFWLFVALFATFMTTPWSALLYENVLPLQRIQAPWRWLIVVSVVLAPAMAEALNAWSQRKKFNISPRFEYSSNLKIAALGFCAIVVLWLPLQAYYISRSYPQLALSEKQRQHNLSWIQHVKTFVAQGGEVPGHRPRNAHTLQVDAPALFRKFGNGAPNYVFADVVSNQQNRPASARASAHASARVEVRLVERTPRRIILALTPTTALSTALQPASASAMTKTQHVVVRVKQFYLEGWSARTEENRNLKVFPSVPDGLMLIDVPITARRVTITLEPFPVETSSARLSLTAFALVALLFASTFLRSRKRVEGQ